MPSGVYIRTKPITEVQREASRKNGRKAGTLPKTEKQIEHARTMGLNNHADTIIEHHNDLCHGAEDPDDTTYMIMKDHSSLHAKLRVQDGTNPFLSKNRTRKIC